ncbi:DUF1642 domain-containing protein [Streptococcus oralis]|uniref:DUF1642 domain-containing protein n=1 Tax=Streptococcus oralis TaxID=1303 RepID=UPI0020011442|nr:DUF1642 domain-containing protein [Streptococcus oralis]
MNKHELIKKYETKGEQLKEFPVVAIGDVLKNLRELDEPEKIQITQFVADWIEYCKFTHVDLQSALVVGDVYFYNYANQKDFSKLKEFLETENNQATFARAWLDGYDIQETKYVVTDGNHLYFKNHQEDIEIVILVDEQPGTMEYVKKFNTKEEAQKAADILGWKVQEVE